MTDVQTNGNHLLEKTHPERAAGNTGTVCKMSYIIILWFFQVKCTEIWYQQVNTGEVCVHCAISAWDHLSNVEINFCGWRWQLTHFRAYLPFFIVK